MNRFEGIKKVKVSLRRNSYKGSKRNSDGSKEFRFFDFAFKTCLAAIMILSVMALGKAGIDAARFFKQDYITEYAQD